MKSLFDRYLYLFIFLFVIFTVLLAYSVSLIPSIAPWIVFLTLIASLITILSKQKRQPIIPTDIEQKTTQIPPQFILENLIDAIDDPVLLLSPSGNVLYQNASVESVLGERFTTIDNLISFSTLWGMIKQSLAIETGANFEWEKQEVVFQTNIAPLHFQHTFFGLIIVMKDITKINKLDLIQTEFIGDLSHELKTPLAAIIGAAEILNQSIRKLTPKEQASFSEMILTESNRMKRLMDELNHLSLLDNKLFSPLFKSEFELYDLLTEVIQVHTLDLEKKTLEVHLDTSCHASVFLDRDKAFQIFSNLMSNAIRYTEKGGVTIRCEIVQKHTVIYFSDTGAGIEPHNLSRVFNRFFRTDFARSRVQGGAGLGLAITRAIIEAHKGKIELKSKIGQGTTFIITLPNIR
jgi:two-component system phosphate regulon sensor histidine kinase PhoR